MVFACAMVFRIKVNMLSPGGRASLSPSTSTMSSFQHTPALTSPIASFQPTPMTDSPLSSYLQAPRTTPTLDASPNSSFPQSPPIATLNVDVQNRRSTHSSEQGNWISQLAKLFSLQTILAFVHDFSLSYLTIRSDFSAIQYLLPTTGSSATARKAE